VGPQVLTSRKASATRRPPNAGETRLSVTVSFVVNVVEAVALGIAAWLTSSVALRAQTAANAADVGVQVFLLIGVVSSVRSADQTHPLGYGREGFFWSLFAAVGIFVGGGGIALAESVQAAVHPATVHSFEVGYVVLAVTVILDLVSLGVGLRPLRKHARQWNVRFRSVLLRSTDPAATTVVVGGSCAVIGAGLAAVGLMATQVTGSALPDTVTSALIGVLLISASVLLVHTNRELLTGRGVALSMQRAMQRTVANQQGVVDVPDLFAIVVGPSSVIVGGDVTFADELEVPDVERAIARCAAALQAQWPSIDYVYLTPVSGARPQRSRRGTIAGAVPL
jgi:cation diffusion facilitator family transporter